MTVPGATPAIISGTACNSDLPATVTVRPPRWAHHDNTLALAGLVLGQAAVNPVLFIVGRFDVTAEIRAVYFDRA
jgi:hypothetical protein